jgi:hypothetical protein
LKYLDRNAQAQYLRDERGIPMSPQRLADLASDGLGPKYVLINGRALSTREDLDAWVAEQAARPVIRRSRGRAIEAADCDHVGEARSRLPSQAA